MAHFSVSGHSGQEIPYTQEGTGVGGRAGSPGIKATSNFLTWKVTRKERGPGWACRVLL